jgi:hypothetical protein
MQKVNRAISKGHEQQSKNPGAKNRPIPLVSPQTGECNINSENSERAYEQRAEIANPVECFPRNQDVAGRVHRACHHASPASTAEDIAGGGDARFKKHHWRENG